MSRRYLSLWLSDWPLQRMRLAARRVGRAFPDERAPLALTASERGVPRLTAVGQTAAALGLVPGMALADARAACPDLLVRQAEPAADAEELAALGLWCARYSPRVMVDGMDGLAIDLTGCSHLFGGERSLMADLDRRLERLGLTRRLAVAGRLAAAWAWARFGAGGLLPAEARSAAGSAGRRPAAGCGPARRPAAAGPAPGRPARRPAPLGPAHPLRPRPADPARPAARPGRRGVRALARAERRSRSGSVGPSPSAAARTSQPPPGACSSACAASWSSRQLGVRRLALGLHRVDGKVARLVVGTSRPVREPGHLFRLLALELDGVDIGFGVEFMLLEALETAPLGAAQADLAADVDAADLDRLVDQLAQRLGAAARRPPAAGRQPSPRARAGADPGRAALAPPPLARPPTPAPAPAAPPRAGRGHGRRARRAALVAAPPPRAPARRSAAAGPERILPEWWRGEPGRPRDYYRVATAAGGTFWVSRDGMYGDHPPPQWRVQGGFA